MQFRRANVMDASLVQNPAPWQGELGKWLTLATQNNMNLKEFSRNGGRCH
jgi:hypothetical protein